MLQGARNATLRSAIFSHDNDYGIDPSGVLPLPRLKVSCVIPYYETGSLTELTIHSLQEALSAYLGLFDSPPQAQIVVVDDGSSRRPFTFATDSAYTRVIRLPSNVGRSAARSVGLLESSGFDLAFFVDSDMLVQWDQIIRTCELWSTHRTGESMEPRVVANLFATSLQPVEGIDSRITLALSTVKDDWRWYCRYQPTWIGCSADWAYVGRVFRLVTDTNYFRQWSGMLGPWSLPNMVLGGCFAVPVDVANEVGGFDSAFEVYGFTETSLVAKLVAHGICVVPQVKSAAVHIEGNPQHFTQQTRNEYFARAHRKFYQDFLAKRV